jgi:predicted ArsR family transcriptional regulator
VRGNQQADPDAKAAADIVVNAAGMRVIRLLVGNPPQTVSELMEATGVTRTAITEQLNELLAAGFVQRTVERLSGRGRPRHLYSATAAALLSLFASNQHLVVPAIWKAIEMAGGEELAGKILKRVSSILASHYLRRITAREPAERLRQLADLLRQEGGLVEIGGKGGQLVIHKRSCAFISMFEERRAVCRVDEDLIRSVVGCMVRRINWRHDGDPCCSFELVPPRSG